MRIYETIFVVDSLLKSEEIDSIINKYERFISANGGQIDATDRWGKKRLAYEIKKRQYGYFVLIRFTGPPTMIKPLEREYRLNESLLRFKTLAMPQVAIKHMEATKKEAPAAPEAPKEKTTEETAPQAAPESPKEKTTEETAPQAASEAEAAQETEISAEDAPVVPEAKTQPEPVEPTVEETPEAPETDAEEKKEE